MTWAEFKRKLEEAGVKDEDRIDFIDVDFFPDISEMKIEIDTTRREFRVWFDEPI